jgi:hypothetical protein
MAKYPKTLGRIEAVWNKLGGEEGVDRFLSGELMVSELIRSWREEDGVIYFSVTSDGTTGKDWIKRLEGNGFRVGDYAKQVLRSPSFVPTNGVTTEVAVLKGMLFEDNVRVTKKIRAEADKRKLTKPNAELACLIRENFTDKEIEAMGLWYIVAMHEPINDSGGGPGLLGASRDVDGRWLNACRDNPGHRWNRDSGLAFVASQLSSFPARAVRRGRVLLRQLSVPAAEHPADLFERKGERGILFRIKRLGLPENQEQDFQCVELPYRQSYPRLFLASGKEGRRSDCLDCLNK